MWRVRSERRDKDESGEEEINARMMNGSRNRKEAGVVLEDEDAGNVKKRGRKKHHSSKVRNNRKIKSCFQMCGGRKLIKRKLD